MNIIPALVTEFCIRLKRPTNLYLFAGGLVIGSFMAGQPCGGEAKE
jgi:hypothetical protein